jgi:hypothetical protein
MYLEPIGLSCPCHMSFFSCLLLVYLLHGRPRFGLAHPDTCTSKPYLALLYCWMLLLLLGVRACYAHSALCLWTLHYPFFCGVVILNTLHFYTLEHAFVLEKGDSCEVNFEGTYPFNRIGSIR